MIQRQNETSAYIGVSIYMSRRPDLVQADEMMGMSWSTEVTGTVSAWSSLNACSQKILRKRKRQVRESWKKWSLVDFEFELQ